MSASAGSDRPVSRIDGRDTRSPASPAACMRQRHAPATLRNREPIATVLARVLPAEGVVLEIASGSGEHVTFFARRFPHLAFVPSDPDPESIESIRAWTAALDMPNVHAPALLDAREPDWQIAPAAVLCINMIHIAPWAATLGLLDGAARHLPPGAPLFLYGPFRRDGAHTAPSNERFDAQLRAGNPDWGVRDLDAVAAEAGRRGLALAEVADMPANNLSVVFRRE